MTKKKPLNSAFLEIRNYLAGKAIGITRDKSLMHEVVKCLFCHVNFESLASQTDVDGEALAVEYRNAFEKIKKDLPSVFDSSEEILLDPDSILYIHDIFISVDLTDPHNDPLSELYQAFVGSEVRGNEGQFFTPTEAVKWLVEAVAPKKGDLIIDPACGAGSFLSFSSRYLRANGVSAKDVQKSIFGIEKDEYLSKLANAHIALSTMSENNIVCGDSIEKKIKDNGPIPFELENTFDVVLANPPFGAKIKIGTEETKRKFELAHRWAKNKEDGTYSITDKLIANPSPQILFMELCVRLLKVGGRMGIVVPESMLTSGSSSYVVQYLLKHMALDAVIGMPENLFKTSGKGGTHTKTCLILATKQDHEKPLVNNEIFMAEAKWCGHDSRGNLIPHNDIPVILDNYLNDKISEGQSYLGYKIKQSDLKNFVLAPRYYNPEAVMKLNSLNESHNLVSLQELYDRGVIEISTGDEVGKLAYGTGDIPFVRTSDISNWEVKLDPKHGVSEEIFKKYAKRQDVQEGDILMVKDGTYLIGTCAFVSKYDTKILYQSHLYKIRVKDKSVISPYLLLAALSSKPVIAQIQSKRFTQDIIDSLGKRIYELVLPLPKSEAKRLEVAGMVEKSINERIESRELARQSRLAILEP
ncbi:restriction endonuclease subunit M [Vibrio vulnificus]|nr:restriction endonuclease subunit M [Vibrio vulnificus]